MKRWLDRLLGRRAKEVAVLREVDRERVRFLMMVREGVHSVDWGMAAAWLAKECLDVHERAHLHRAVAAVWLDEVRDSMKADYRRWRHARVEGLGAMERNIAQHAAEAADRALVVIGEALEPILEKRPIPPVGVLAFASIDEYMTFIAPHYPEEGNFATSGGLYIRSDGDSFPFLALPVIPGHGVGETIAHELTHHALVGMDLPLWVEEGLTQMMEERVMGESRFTVTRDGLERHRRRWKESGLDGFWSGDSFHSPHEDEQELAYHLSQMLVRSQLDRDAGAFFGFVRDCRLKGSEAACREHLGEDLDEVVWKSLGR